MKKIEDISPTAKLEKVKKKTVLTHYLQGDKWVSTQLIIDKTALMEYPMSGSVLKYIGYDDVNGDLFMRIHSDTSITIYKGHKNDMVY